MGKSFLLRQRYENAFWVQLLKNEEFTRYTANPQLLRERLLALQPRPDLVVIDEVQRVPALLDEVHLLHEEHGFSFALCGSSARKVKRGHANLLGGRALRYELHGLTAHELGGNFDLTRFLNHGYLPRIYDFDDPAPALEAYCSDYLKEEIFAESLTRNLPAFSRFLQMASLSDAETVSFESLARDCEVSPSTAKDYFQILEDTLIGSFVPAFTARPKRRVGKKPKFYFFDVGLVNFLARRSRVTPGSELFGKAFENWVHHELRAYISYHARGLDLSYWRLSTGAEVDFILGNLDLAIEAKASAKIHSDHLKGLRELKLDHPKIKRRWVVCLEPQARLTEDGIEILPYQEFLNRLSRRISLAEE